jgi:hypothetical protein
MIWNLKTIIIIKNNNNCDELRLMVKKTYEVFSKLQFVTQKKYILINLNSSQLLLFFIIIIVFKFQIILFKSPAIDYYIIWVNKVVFFFINLVTTRNAMDIQKSDLTTKKREKPS